MTATVLSKLRISRGNFAAALTMSCLIRKMSAAEVAAKGRVVLGENGTFYIIPPGKTLPEVVKNFFVVEMRGDDAARERAAIEVSKMAVRNLTLDSFEAISDYCKSTGQLDQMKAQLWYWFARVMRNSLTHDQRFKFDRSVLTHLPITWKSKTIELAMDGKEVPFTMYGWYEAAELFEEMFKFAEGLK